VKIPQTHSFWMVIGWLVFGSACGPGLEEGQLKVEGFQMVRGLSVSALSIPLSVEGPGVLFAVTGAADSATANLEAESMQYDNLNFFRDESTNSGSSASTYATGLSFFMAEVGEAHTGAVLATWPNVNMESMLAVGFIRGASPAVGPHSAMASASGPASQSLEIDDFGFVLAAYASEDLGETLKLQSEGENSLGLVGKEFGSHFQMGIWGSDLSETGRQGPFKGNGSSNFASSIILVQINEDDF